MLIQTTVLLLFLMDRWESQRQMWLTWVLLVSLYLFNTVLGKHEASWIKSEAILIQKQIHYTRYKSKKSQLQGIIANYNDAA